eukprot:m.12941 g.12941  ORF g.12941 m.12941 type:complete len:393 (+) comp2770_c0_seq1:28-1206(+)
MRALSAARAVFRTCAPILHTTPPRMLSILPRGNWTEAVSRAEELVGSPTSLANFRSLLGNEVGALDVYAKRLISSQHPFLEAAKDLILSDGPNRQFRGLCVLLMSKALAPTRRKGEQDGAAREPILPKQRALAEICELIHAATQVHAATVNMTGGAMRVPTDDFLFANKMSVLGGDFLLASACTALARLHNVRVVYLMSAAIGESMEGRFSQPAATSLTLLEDWIKDTHLAGGSLLARGCEAVAVLAGLDDDTQAVAHTFGRHLGIAHEISQSARVLDGRASPKQVSGCAAVVFALSRGQVYDSVSGAVHGSLDIDYSQQRTALVTALEDYTKRPTSDGLSDIRDLVAILNGASCRVAAQAHAAHAIAALAPLAPSEAVDALRRMAAVVANP